MHPVPKMSHGYGTSSRMHIYIHISLQGLRRLDADPPGCFIPSAGLTAQAAIHLIFFIICLYIDPFFIYANPPAHKDSWIVNIKVFKTLTFGQNIGQLEKA